MGMALPLLLLVIWLYLAWRSFQRGDLAMAGLFLVIGIALTVYRLRLAAKRGT